jgi:hypothetical protein
MQCGTGEVVPVSAFELCDPAQRIANELLLFPQDQPEPCHSVGITVAIRHGRGRSRVCDGVQRLVSQQLAEASRFARRLIPALPLPALALLL